MPSYLRGSLIFLAAFAAPSLGINILGLMGVPSPSHHNWNRNIFYQLAAKGHNLTVLSADVDREKTPGLHYIKAENVYESLYNGSESLSIMDMVGESPFAAVSSFFDWGTASCEAIYRSKGFKTLLNYPESFKFDLVIIDYSIEPCLLGFLHKFRYPPTVGVSPFSIPPATYDFIGGSVLPSYVVHFDGEFDFDMNFYERVYNYVLYSYEAWYRTKKYLPERQKAMKEAFRMPDLPDVRTLQSKIILALTNTHFSIEKKELLPPNVIPVGGLQIQEPKPLDTDLLAFVESAQKGAVLFSLGTNMKSEFMDDASKRAFIEAFRQIPQYNFVWKYESDLGIQLPSNVKTLGWVRQNDILAHPKTKAFISHCGLLGTLEAAWYGVPVVGIPFFADQHRNIRVGIKEGTSVKLDYTTLTATSIRAALLKVLEDPSYQKNANRRSRVFQDQPMKPIDTAIFWIEWALRNHEHSSVIQLPIRQLGDFVAKSYDVILFLLALVVLLVGGFVLALCRIFCEARPKKEKLKKK